MSVVACVVLDLVYGVGGDLCFWDRWWMRQCSFLELCFGNEMRVLMRIQFLM